MFRHLLLTLFGMGYFMDVKSMEKVKNYPPSKISPCYSFELTCGTNVPCYMRFLNLKKYIRKQSEECWCQHFLSEKWLSLEKGTFCIFSYKNISRKHFWKWLFIIQIFSYYFKKLKNNKFIGGVIISVF